MTFADKRQADIRHDIGVQTRMRDADRFMADKKRHLNPDTAAGYDHAVERHQRRIDQLQQELRKWEAEI